MAVNTTESIQNPSESITAKANAELEIARQKFSKERQVDIAIPASYRTRIGQTWFAAINGVQLSIPVDGEKYKVPQSFADMWYEYQSNLTL